MIIPRKIPRIQKAPVHISEDEVEVWYGKPISLGKVDKIGNYWYTIDGTRHTSTRSAMEYLIRAHEAGTVLVPRKVEPQPRMRKPGPPRVMVTPEVAESLQGLDPTDPLVSSILQLLRQATLGKTKDAH